MKKRFYNYNQRFRIIKNASCKELSECLSDAGGDIHCCPLGGAYFLDRSDDDLEPTLISESWAWIQDQRPNKKLLVLDFPNESMRWGY